MAETEKRLRMATGNWVVGDRFWDRDDDMELIIQRVDEGAHLLLVAQRRMGKTSVLHELKRRVGDRYLSVFLDLQKEKDAPAAVVALSMALRPIKGVWDKCKELFGNVLGTVKQTVEKVEVAEMGVTLRAGLTNQNWAAKGDRLFDILATCGRPVLLLLDEVPILVNRILKGGEGAITPERKADADLFMSWLRRNATRHKGKVCMVLSGSIGLEPVLHQAGLSATLTSFDPFELKPWDEQTSVECLHALANAYDIQLKEGAAARMFERLGCGIPHHVQRFFSHVRDHCARTDWPEVTADEVDDVYEREMLSVRGHAELSHYEERLRMILDGQEHTLALEILTEAAVAGRLTRGALSALGTQYADLERPVVEAQRDILQLLEHDGYLKRAKTDYVFVSKLLRDWWGRRYGHFHTMVSERGE